MATDHGMAAAAPTDGEPERRFLVAWQDPESRVFESIGQLDLNDGTFRYRYLPHAREIAQLRPLPQFPDLDQVYESSRLFVLFAQRIMNRRRPDYADWVNMLGLDQDAPDLEVLARSEGQRLGDNIRLFPEPEVQANGYSTSTFFVHGVRHRIAVDSEVEATLEELVPGAGLRLTPEPGNPVNPLAVSVDHSSVPLGWVPNPLVDYVHTLITSGPVDVKVTQNNGRGAPPNLRLLITVKGRFPPGHRPFESL